MESFFSSLTGILPVLFLVVMNGFFVAVETAMVRTHSSKLKAPEFKDKFGVSSSIYLLENIERSISTTQLGITVLSLTLGWYGEGVFHQIFVHLFAWVEDEALQAILSHSVATLCALTAVTFLHVVLGELVAKSVAIRYPEITLRCCADTLKVISQIMRPAVAILNGSARAFLSFFGMSAPVSERIHSTGELAALISHSTEQGILDEDEEQMLQGVFGFSETIAREVMTPRTDLVTISKDASLHDIIATIGKSGFSRFPVIDKTIDNVVGILLSKDLLSVIEEYGSPGAKRFDVTTIMREPYFIPATKSINDLLKEFKRTKLHLAIVFDEHGGVDGAVTLEDLIEEIVGDIYDESDDVETDIVVEESGDIILDGGVLVDEVNDRFELDIPEGEYDTIAGFIMSSLGRVPSLGEEIRINKAGIALVGSPDSHSSSNGVSDKSGDGDGDMVEGLTESELAEAKTLFIVEKVTGNRVESVRVQQLRDPKAPPLKGDEIASNG